ncbi:MAG: sensor domain-containing diguanylate cyclase [Candidatus Nanopelagicales bacterium]
MTDADLAVRRLEAVAALLRLPLDTPERDALRLAIDAAEALTGSRIGYLHYLNDDQVTIELSTWSTGTADYCTAAYDRHYPIDRAGIWADTARTRSARVHNDYDAEPDRRGLPEGHSVLLRHLGVPAVDAGGAVRLLLGVGNKDQPYDDADVATAQLIADETWRVVARLREHQAAVADLAMLRGRQSSARLATWEWDPALPRLSWDDEAPRVLGLAEGGTPGPDWDWLLGRLDRASARQLAAALDRIEDSPGLLLDLRAAREGGGRVRLRLSGEWVARPQGLGRVLRGSVMDVSVEDEVERARHAALHDPLTGLPNRAWLTDRLAALTGAAPGADPAADRAADPASEPGVAVHVVDLDDFRLVNEEHGHFVGDEVLRACADRLATVMRGGESVARIGVDEFVLVQTGGPDPDAITALAERARAALARPIVTAAGELRLRASIGVARSRPGGEAVRALLGRADRALYDAVRSGRAVVVDLGDTGGTADPGQPGGPGDTGGGEPVPARS